MDHDTEKAVALLREERLQVNCDPTHIVLEGDMGGTLYLTCPVKDIIASFEEIDELLAWLEENYWHNHSAGCDWYFASTEIQNQQWHKHSELQARFTEEEYTRYGYGICAPLNDELWVDDLEETSEHSQSFFESHIRRVLLGKE